MSRVAWVMVVLVAGATWWMVAREPVFQAPFAMDVPRPGVRLALPGVDAGASEVEVASDLAEAHPLPEGFCGGPTVAPGFTRPSSAQAVVQALKEALERGGATAQQRGVLLALEAMQARNETQRWSLAQDARRVGAQEPAVWAAVGWVAAREGLPWTAWSAWKQATAALPDMMPFHRELAEAAAQTHDVETAAVSMQRYAERYPGDWAAVRRARLFEVQREIEADFVEFPAPDFPVKRDRSVPDETVRAVVQAMRDGLPAVRRFFDGPRDPVAVVIYAERADLLATTCAQGWANAVFDGRLRLQNEAGGVLHRPDVLSRVVTHELTHVLHRRSAGRADGWLVEGLARYVAGEQDAGYLRHLALLAQNGSYIPFSSMSGPFAVLESADDSSLAYDQALMMVRWVVDRAGEEGLKRLVVVHGKPEPTLDVLSSITGEPVERLGGAFLDWVRAQARSRGM